MATDFDIFNRPASFTLHRKTSPTSGHFDAQDRWVKPTVTTPAPVIQGHLSMVERMNRESQWSDSQVGVIEKGMLRFFTEVLLQKGDVIESLQEGGVTYLYRVMGMVRAHRFMAQMTGKPVRYEYDLHEVPQ